MGKSMLDLQIAGKTTTTLADTDLLLAMLDPAGTPDDAVIEWGDVKAMLDLLYQPLGAGGGSNSICDGRLTLESGVPVSVTNQTAKTTVYFTPYVGSKIALYDGASAWNVRTFTEISVAVPSNTSTPFDVFCYDNSGTPALEALAWTNDTTRATALVYQNGVLVKSGATTRRYLGTCRTTTVSGQCEDSDTKRFVWNMYNRVFRGLFTCPGYVDDNTATSYLTVGTSWAEANGGTGSRISWVLGQSGVPELLFSVLAQAAASSYALAGVGIDSVSQSIVSAVSPVAGALTASVAVNNKGLPLAVGGHYAAILICRIGTNNATFYADGGRRGGEAADSPNTFICANIPM